MVRVLTVLLIVPYLYFIDSVLAQNSSIAQHCIQHYQSENSCYKMSQISGENGTYISQVIASLSYGEDTKLFTITFYEGFLSDQELLVLRITLLKLCRKEALRLTVEDLECGLRCTTRKVDQISNSIVAQCGQVDDTDTASLNGYSIVILFRPSNTSHVLHTCNNLSVQMVLVDTSGKSNSVVEQKFSRDPIFEVGPSAKIEQSNLHGWKFQYRECAFRLLFCVFNFVCGLPVNCTIKSLEIFRPYSIFMTH